MMHHVIISSLESGDDTVEVVERKGLGHPDTICDALAEALSRGLCREYQQRFGAILHHNVDKALLRAGCAVAAFGAGAVTRPIDIYLAGRAVCSVGTEVIPVGQITVDSARAWLSANLHALDAQRHVRIHNLVRPGSQDLRMLFARREGRGVALANDTSVGVGHAPLSALERLVLAVEKRINSRDRARNNPAWGEDVKVMGVRCGDRVQLTISCAMIGRYLAHMDDYLAEKAALKKLVQGIVAEHGFAAREVAVNAADDFAAGSVYLTVTGTSAEAGDDGQVGRGNRINGLITPCRPMSLEAAAGKNPVTHVGKIYNVVARNIADALVAAVPEIAGAQCLMVSSIGAPVSEPAIMHIKLATRNGAPAVALKAHVEEIVAERLASIPDLLDAFVAGRIELF
jgi:S-adenosylmethionine synthetase